MNIGNQIQKQILDIFQEETEDSLKELLDEWEHKCIDLLFKAKVLEQQYEKLKTIQVSVPNSTLLNYAEQKNDISTDHLVTDMYKFLNEVGEKLRGEEIKYEVTLTTGRGKKQQIETFVLSLEEFLEITQTTHTRLTLKKTRTILNQLHKNLDEKSKQWSEIEIFDYQRFIYNAKRVQNQKWKSVNRGNLLEAYRRYQDLRQSGVHTGSTTIAMKETLSGTQGFWQGPDYKGFQIKGNAASVANIYTCINQINKLYSSISGLKIQWDIMEKKNQEMSPAITDQVENEIDTILNDLIKQFLIDKKI